MDFSYVRRAVCAMHDGLGQEASNDAMFPSEEQFMEEMRNMDKILPRDKDGKLLHASLDGVRTITSLLWTNWSIQCVCAIDGTEIIIQRPEDPELEQLFFSAKKKQHSINILFLVLLDGRIIYKSKAFTGNFCDQSAWNFTNLRDTFVGEYALVLVDYWHISDKLYGITGDAGFVFNRASDKEEIKGSVPYSNKNGKTVTPEQKQDNRNIARVRVIVENLFAILKKWECLSRMYDTPLAI